MRKNSKKWQIFTQKIGVKTHLWWVFGHVWTKFFMLVNFSPTLSTYYTFLGQKYTIDFSPDFSHFFTTRPTSESCWEPLKVIPEGSMVEYLPFGSKEAPQTISAKKNFPSPEILNHTPSPLCNVDCIFVSLCLPWDLSNTHSIHNCTLFIASGRFPSRLHKRNAFIIPHWWI